MENQTKVHRVSWYPDVRFNHSSYAKANGTTSCSNIYCHGASLTGVTLSGPSCSTCHTWPLNLADCASCHGTPPTGAVFPNIAGRHSAHAGLPLSSNILCATCHEAAGAGTTLHINNVADALIDQAFSAKTGGAALYNATGNTCSNVSCHGGQITPVWLDGTIDVGTQCTSCHASGTAQYNSYNSGKHSEHIINAEIACITCHDTTLLVNNHFTHLDTTTMEGPASATISSALTYTPGATPGTGSCTPLCHGTRSW
jgi:predicted CxxxxCH...CXXCH cytochrome family protein